MTGTGGRDRHRWPRIELAEPSDPAADPTAEMAPWWPSRTAAAIRSRWRPWMAAPVLLLVVAAAAVTPLDATATRLDAVVDARRLVEVRIDPSARGAGAREGGYSGAYLLPSTRTTSTALAWAVTAIAPDRTVGPAPQPRILQEFDVLDVALLTGAGVAPGRGDPAALGLSARPAGPDVPSDQLGVLLHVIDEVNGLDVAAGRRILALGSVTGTGAVSCTADAAAAVAASRPAPDVVVVGAGCAADLDLAVPVLQAATLTDALVQLAGP